MVLHHRHQLECTPAMVPHSSLTLKPSSHNAHQILSWTDLSGNPLANEVNYRLRVIHTFPKLKVLDKHEVTVDERTEAKVLFEEIKVSNVAFTKTKPDWKNPPAQEMACLSIMTKDMYKEIEKFKAQVWFSSRKNSAFQHFLTEFRSFSSRAYHRSIMRS